MYDNTGEFNYELDHDEPGNPGAGASFTSAAGDNSRRLLLQVSFDLQCAVAAANRLPTITITSTGALDKQIAISPAVITASLRGTFMFTRGGVAASSVPGGATGVWQSAGLPSDLWLNPADTFSIIIVNMQAADTIENIVYTWARRVLPNV